MRKSLTNIAGQNEEIIISKSSIRLGVHQRLGIQTITMFIVLEIFQGPSMIKKFGRIKDALVAIRHASVGSHDCQEKRGVKMGRATFPKEKKEEKRIFGDRR
jgi:hypothetical protein